MWLAQQRIYIIFFLKKLSFIGFLILILIFVKFGEPLWHLLLVNPTMLSISPPLPARLRVITIILFIVITTMKMGFLLIDFRSLTNCLPFTYLVMIPSLYCGRYLQNSNLSLLGSNIYSSYVSLVTAFLLFLMLLLPPSFVHAIIF